MTSYNFGDVVLIAFPFTNLETTKKRPAVIISNASYQLNRPDVILMAITSQIKKPLQFGETIVQDWQSAGLIKPSVLKPLIATFEQGRIVKKMGELSKKDQQTLKLTIQTLLSR